MDNNEGGAMRAPPPNNKNRAASMTFQMALKIMEQLLTMFMEQQRRADEQRDQVNEQRDKIILEAILSRNGRTNIDTAQLLHNSGEQINASETRANDRSTEAATKKPVPHQEMARLG